MQNVVAFLRLAPLIALALAPPFAGAAERLSIVGLFKGKAIVLVDGKQLILTVGQTTPGGLRLLAADSHQAVIDDAGQQRAFKLGGSISTVFATPPPTALVQVWPDAGNMYKVQGSLNDSAVTFLIDTGATFVAMNEPTAQRIGVAYKQTGIEGTSMTASGVAKTYVVKLDKVRVGGIELRDVTAAVIPGEHPRDVLLGNSFLSRISMARSGQVMELRGK
jgi:aspartyl protease family protein